MFEHIRSMLKEAEIEFQQRYQREQTLTLQVRTYEEQIGLLKKRISDLTKENHKLHSLLTNTEESVEDTMKSYNKMQTLEERFKILQQENETLTEEIRKLKEELQKSKEEKQELQKFNEDQRSLELSRFRQHLEQREEEIEKLKSENCEMKKREEQFRLKMAEELTQKEELITKTQLELNQLRKEHQRTIQEHAEQLHKTRMKYEEHLLQVASQVSRVTSITYPDQKTKTLLL